MAARSPITARCSWFAIANREHRAVIGLAIVILLLALKATYNDLFWRAAAGPQ